MNTDRISWEDRIDLSEPLNTICERLGLDPTFVASIDFRPGDLTAHVYLGRDGMFQGPKYIQPNGEPAMTKLDFKIRS